jgi:hypothetical protein
MKIFFGTAIQGKQNRSDRSEVNNVIFDCIKENGGEITYDHSLGISREDTGKRLEKVLGTLPSSDLERRVLVRNKMIEMIEGDIDAIIFEVSVPSLGTGVEIAHAYLRPRMGLKAIPILILYQKDYWPHNLSTMIKGLTVDTAPTANVKEYTTLEEIDAFIKDFLKNTTTSS